MKTIYLESTLILLVQLGKEKEVTELLMKGKQKITEKGEIKYLLIEE